VQSFLPGIRTVFAWMDAAGRPRRAGAGRCPTSISWIRSTPGEILAGFRKAKAWPSIPCSWPTASTNWRRSSKHYGFREEAAGYRQLAHEAQGSDPAVVLRPGPGLFADTPGKKSFSQHANALAVLTDAVPVAEQAALLEKTLADTSLVSCALYFRFYLFNALGKAGLGDRYVGQLQPWRNMLKDGLSTFSEWEVQPRSDCHAWSASPNYHLLSLVCGMTPGSPGFRTVLIQPQLGSLRWVRGTLPHPDGPVSVDFKRGAKGQLNGTVTLPPGVNGKLRWQNKELDLKPGPQVVKL
jgi:hypothetical protein